jgi:hypothetical protein
MSNPATTYGVAAVSDTARQPNWLYRVFERLFRARELQAERLVVNYLAGLTNARLAEIGYTPAQIRQIRLERKLPVAFDA